LPLAYLELLKKPCRERRRTSNTLGECQNDNGDNIENIIDDDLSGIPTDQMFVERKRHSINRQQLSNFEEILANSSISPLAREIAEDINIEEY
jgi:hypothetical protein